MLSNGAYCINCIVLYWSGSYIKMIIITYMLFITLKNYNLYIIIILYPTVVDIFYCNLQYEE